MRLVTGACFVVLLSACAPDNQIGMRPDVPPGLDAALAPDAPADTGDMDAALAPDAVAELDAPSADDAAITPDAAAPDDAFVVMDAGRDAGGADAYTPRDAGRVWSIGFCRVQYPPTISVASGTSTTVYGRVYVVGLTTRSGGTDTDPLLVGQVGSGPDGTHPSMPTWTWAAATANTGYGTGSAGYEMNNDEYQGDLVRTGTGSYDYAFRFSGDGGLTWTYCDTLDAGSSDGYQVANAGSLTLI